MEIRIHPKQNLRRRTTGNARVNDTDRAQKPWKGPPCGTGITDPFMSLSFPAGPVLHEKPFWAPTTAMAVRRTISSTDAVFRMT